MGKMAGISSSTALNYGVVRERMDWGNETRDWVLDRVRSGDPKAVAVLYDRHHETVRGFAKHLVGDADTAEDLVHEVFVTLPKAIRRFRGEASLRTFILGITANHSRHFIRSAARRRKAYERLAQNDAPMVSTPEKLAEQRELATLLQRALDGLNTKHRVVFVLCDIEEKTSAEAAEILKIPAATVRTRLFNARRKLRSFLEKEGVR